MLAGEERNKSVSQDQVQQFLDHAAKEHDERVMAGESSGNLFPRPVYEEPPQEQRSKLVQSRVLRARAKVAANHSQLGLLEPSDDGWNFAALCRGEELRSELPHLLRCRHETRGGQTWLRLGPARLEEIHRQPDITVFHNIISTRELADIRHTAAPRVSTQHSLLISVTFWPTQRLTCCQLSYVIKTQLKAPKALY